MTDATSSFAGQPPKDVAHRPGLLLSSCLLAEIAQISGLCLVSLLTLLLAGRILKLRDMFLNLDLGLLELGMLFVFLSPFFLVLLVPISCMMGVFLTFLRMNTDKELAALKAGGVNLYQLLPAPIVFSLFCAGVTLIVSLYGVSWGMNNFRETVMDYARTRTQLVLQPGVFNQDFPGLMVYARQVDRETGVLTDVIVEDRTREDITAVITAPRGAVATDSAQGQILFALENGTVYRQQRADLSVLSFGTYTVRLNLEKLLKRLNLGEAQPKEFSWSRLRLLAAMKQPPEGRNANFLRKVRVELHKRWSLPASCLVLGLFSLPLAASFGGLGRQYGVLLALACSMVYYTLLSLGFSLGESGELSPAVGLWLPNAVFLAVALANLHMANEERALRVVDRLRHMRWPFSKPDRQSRSNGSDHSGGES